MPSRSDVQRVFEERVLPLVQADGGEIEILDVTDEGVVRVRLGKACSGCPGSQFTVGSLLRRELREAVEGVREIEIVVR